MTDVIIYRPTKNAMQSGKGNIKHWQLDFIPQPSTRSIENVMGWTSSSDMKQELRMTFDTKEDAIAYAERMGLRYELRTPQEMGTILKSYTSNFTQPTSYYEEW
jgi:hypothetical protein